MCGNFTDPDCSGDTGGGERDGWGRGGGGKGGGGRKALIVVKSGGKNLERFTNLRVILAQGPC